MSRSMFRWGSILGMAMLLVMAGSVVWAAPISFMVGQDDITTPGLVPAGLGTDYNLVLTIGEQADLFKDVAKNAVINLGVLNPATTLDDVLVGRGPFSISTNGTGKMTVNATLMPVNGGFLSGPIAAQVTFNAANFDNTSVALNAVPEPTSLLLLGPSLAGLAWLRRRYQQPNET
jgi:PEP-CTERM motif